MTARKSVAPFDGGESWKEVSLMLHEIGAIKFGKFTLTSGRVSPFYMDLRLVPSHPEVFNRLTDLCVGLIKREIKGPIDKIAGVPEAGLIFATAVSLKLGLPLILVRKERKVHGLMKIVEGAIKPGESVVLIDDLTTTGTSIKNAAEAIRAEGGKIGHSVVILDRGEGAREMLEKNKIRLHPCVKFADVVEYLRDSSLLDEKKYRQVMEYLRRASK